MPAAVSYIDIDHDGSNGVPSRGAGLTNLGPAGDLAWKWGQQGCAAALSWLHVDARKSMKSTCGLNLVSIWYRLSGLPS
jgi:hypothetical protein